MESEYPRNAQHFAFAFEPTDLHNLLNFSYSLIENKGKLIKLKNKQRQNAGIKL